MNTIKAYKLFRIRDGKLYPLYVNANKETKIGEWLTAEDGELTTDGKHVKSKLGKLAYRPGWHLGDIPYASHIGKKQADGTLAQAEDTVWCECDVETTLDYQGLANIEGTNKKGKLIPVMAQLRYVPLHGTYRYKTSPKMTGTWIIAGNIKVNRVLTNEEVATICRNAGVEPQKLAKE